ncbi:MAG: hypothetical protein IPQ21_02510 [Betaproteobacteria bacterium]|nr:hypothetical protein [Betaproteobacteria bacterium]
MIGRNTEGKSSLLRILAGPERPDDGELQFASGLRRAAWHRCRVEAHDLKRLAARVPRPRLYLIRFHGVLATNAKLRPLVVPQGPPAQVPGGTEATAATEGEVESEVESAQARPQRISWARLLKRVFDIDMQHCPNCGGGELRIIPAIPERPVIEKFLIHLGLDPAAAAQESGARGGGDFPARSRPGRKRHQRGPRHQAELVKIWDNPDSRERDGPLKWHEH